MKKIKYKWLLLVLFSSTLILTLGCSIDEQLGLNQNNEEKDSKNDREIIDEIVNNDDQDEKEKDKEKDKNDNDSDVKEEKEENNKKDGKKENKDKEKESKKVDAETVVTNFFKYINESDLDKLSKIYNNEPMALNLINSNNKFGLENEINSTKKLSKEDGLSYIEVEVEAVSESNPEFNNKTTYKIGVDEKEQKIEYFESLRVEGI